MDGQEKDTEKSIEWGAMLKMREGVVKMGGLRDLRKEKLSKNLIYRKIYCFTILLFTHHGEPALHRCSYKKVFRKQTYRKIPTPKCDFNEVSKQLYGNRTSTPFYKKTSVRLLLTMFRANTRTMNNHHYVFNTANHQYEKYISVVLLVLWYCNNF